MRRDSHWRAYLVSVAGPKMYKVDGARWMNVFLENTQLLQVIHVDGGKLKFEAYKTSRELFDAFFSEKIRQRHRGRIY